MKSVSDRRSREYDALETLRADLAAVKKDLSAMASNGAARASRITRSTLDDVSSSVKDFAEDGKERALEAHKQLSDFAGERPLTTIAAALAAGALVGRIAGWMNRR